MNDLEAIGFVAILIGLLVVVGLGFSPPIKGVNQPFDYHQIARQDAAQAGISADLFEKQIEQESGFNPDAVSSAGAVGIAQFEPETAQGLGIDPHDPVASLQGAAQLMARYNAQYGDYAKALSSYNCGTMCTNNAINQCGVNWEQCIPIETQRYIAIILG